MRRVPKYCPCYNPHLTRYSDTPASLFHVTSPEYPRVQNMNQPVASDLVNYGHCRHITEERSPYLPLRSKSTTRGKFISHVEYHVIVAVLDASTSSRYTIAHVGIVLTEDEY